MGFGFGGFKMPSLGKVFGKRGIQAFLGSAGGLLPGVQELMLTDKGNEIYETIHKGLGNLVTGGYISQMEANKIMKKNAKEAKAQYEEAQRKADAEAARIANLEEEKRRRLANYGNKVPQTLLNTYLGVSGGANVSRPTLG